MYVLYVCTYIHRRREMCRTLVYRTLEKTEWYLTISDIPSLYLRCRIEKRRLGPRTSPSKIIPLGIRRMITYASYMISRSSGPAPFYKVTRRYVRHKNLYSGSTSSLYPSPRRCNMQLLFLFMCAATAQYVPGKAFDRYVAIWLENTDYPKAHDDRASSLYPPLASTYVGV
jgi:hypothetical protein